MLGIFADCVGYENLIDFILRHKILDVRGDMVEVGAFLGGGTRKLSELLRLTGDKKLYTIDCFDCLSDTEVDYQGIRVVDVYKDLMGLYCFGKTQEETFQENTKDCHNLVVIKGDSAKVDVPCDSLCFAFIDGAHDESHVESDFYMVWNNLAHGGVISFHDYMAGYPLLTSKLNGLMMKHQEEITLRVVNPNAHILFIVKR